MSMEHDMLLGWEWLCLQRLGRFIPPNAIDFDANSGTGCMNFVVPHGDPPLILKDGSPVRVLTLYYHYKDMEDVYRH